MAIYPFLSRQVIQLSKEELIGLLKSQLMPVSSFSSKTKQALSKVGEC